VRVGKRGGAARNGPNECIKGVSKEQNKAKINYVLVSAAVVRFRPVFAQYFLNLERDYGSGSTICPNLGPDHSERFGVVRFWFRTGSDLRTSQIYLLIIQMLNTTTIPPFHMLKSSPGV
jgi:hypothetical protein